MVIGYGASEFEIKFKKGKISTDYLLLDHNLHANASGLAGSMFPLDKLASIIEAAAKDIEFNYNDILSGDPDVWKRIGKLILAQREWKPYLP